MKQNKTKVECVEGGSRRSVLTASLARHRSALAMVIDALASALVTR